MKFALIVGMLFLCLGIVTLTYYASPVRELSTSYAPQHFALAVPVVGGASLACGILILFLCRSRKP